MWMFLSPCQLICMEHLSHQSALRAASLFEHHLSSHCQEHWARMLEVSDARAPFPCPQSRFTRKHQGAPCTPITVCHQRPLKMSMCLCHFFIQCFCSFIHQSIRPSSILLTPLPSSLYPTAGEVVKYPSLHSSEVLHLCVTTRVFGVCGCLFDRSKEMLV